MIHSDALDCSEHEKGLGIKVHSTVTVGTKGQVVIPSDVRNLLGIRPGDTLMVITKLGKAIGMIKLDDIDALMEYIKKERHQ